MVLRIWSQLRACATLCCFNTKLPWFNSRFLQPGSEAVDTFSQGRSSDNNWLVPPIVVIDRFWITCVIVKLLEHWLFLYGKSAYYWTILCKDCVHFHSFVMDWSLFANSQICSWREGLKTIFLEPERWLLVPQRFLEFPDGFLYFPVRLLFRLQLQASLIR